MQSLRTQGHNLEWNGHYLKYVSVIRRHLVSQTKIELFLYQRGIRCQEVIAMAILQMPSRSAVHNVLKDRRW